MGELRGRSVELSEPMLTFAGRMMFPLPKQLFRLYAHLLRYYVKSDAFLPRVSGQPARFHAEKRVYETEFGPLSAAEIAVVVGRTPLPRVGRVVFIALASRRSPEEWAQAAAAYKDTEDDTAFQALWHRMMHGALTIGTQGCTLDTLLLCDGADAGQVVYFDWSMFEGNPPFFTGKSFEEWMEGYFRKVVAGDIQRCSHVHWSVDW